ncbi:hypothetical protein SprV_0200721800 [Sparganum proliferum]
MSFECIIIQYSYGSLGPSREFRKTYCRERVVLSDSGSLIANIGLRCLNMRSQMCAQQVSRPYSGYAAPQAQFGLHYGNIPNLQDSTTRRVSSSLSSPGPTPTQHQSPAVRSAPPSPAPGRCQLSNGSNLRFATRPSPPLYYPELLPSSTYAVPRDPSSEGEVADAIRKLRNKAPGENEIPAEIYKSCVDTGALAP